MVSLQRSDFDEGAATDQRPDHATLLNSQRMQRPLKVFFLVQPGPEVQEEFPS